MPSPRFGRLPPERRAQLLSVARGRLARGADAASYNQIIAESGISKTTAYLYFDGKEDLVAEVWRDLLERLGAVLGPWRPAASATDFWRQLSSASDALRRHLGSHPDDLGLLAQAQAQARGDPSPLDGWFVDLVDNGVALSVIRDDLPRPLLVAATAAVFRVIDAHVLERLVRGRPVDAEPGWALLRGLWAAPMKPRRRKRGR